jgi:ribosomal protein S18 acetylase RimI-like enzyme
LYNPTMETIHILTNTSAAKKIGEFLTGPFAFDQTWAPEEKQMAIQAPLDSLENSHHCYWYIEQNGEIVGAAGIRENKYGSGGYEMDSDYIAVHKNHRRKGYGTQLLKEIEDFVKENSGRYIHVVSCDIESYEPARIFYQRKGYTKVAALPNYYVAGEGRVDFYKEVV